jgi:2-amino-4-hydroxy-6-hydroxymethyldihydropteridine diphosphokinase
LNEAGNLKNSTQNYSDLRKSSVISAGKYHQVYLGLGSNIAPDKNLVRGVTFLRQYVIVLSISNVWETAPVPPVGPNYLNAAIFIQTLLTPSLLKSIILRRIEVQLGRIRTSHKNAPRTIDLDILIFDGQLLDTKVWTHAFVAVPLAELIPGYTNPTTGETLQEAAARLAKDTVIKIRPEVSLKMYPDIGPRTNLPPDRKD